MNIPFLTVALAFLVVVPSVAAKEFSDDRLPFGPLTVRLGVFDMNSSTSVRVNGRNRNIGSKFNFEE